MKTQYTPGPWAVEENSSPPLIWGNDYEKPIAEVELHRSYADYKDGEVQANARLIAAAPDLLDACYQLIYALMYDDEEELNNGMISARDAITKATGEADE